jgi:hypothetical protein
MKLFSPDFNPDGSATLGYVAHSSDPNSRYQRIGNFFIGTGPIWLGTAVCFFIAWVLFGDSIINSVLTEKSDHFEFNFVESIKNMLNISYSLFSQIFTMQYLSDWKTYLYLYLMFCIGNHITLSPPDIKQSFSGLATIIFTLLLFNITTMWIGNFALKSCEFISEYTSLFYTVMILSSIITLITSIIILTTGGCFMAMLKKVGLRTP